MVAPPRARRWFTTGLQRRSRRDGNAGCGRPGRLPRLRRERAARPPRRPARAAPAARHRVGPGAARRPRRLGGAAGGEGGRGGGERGGPARPALPPGRRPRPVGPCLRGWGSRTTPPPSVSGGATWRTTKRSPAARHERALEAELREAAARASSRPRPDRPAPRGCRGGRARGRRGWAGARVERQPTSTGRWPRGRRPARAGRRPRRRSRRRGRPG